MRREKILFWSAVAGIFIGLLICMKHWSGNFQIERGNAEDGILDVSNRLKDETVFSMDGQWKISQGLTAGDTSRIEGCTDVPGNWASSVVDGKKLGTYGQVTYRIKIKVQETGEYSILLQYISSAYRLYINGELVHTCGQVGTNKKNEQAKWLPTIVYFHTDSTNIDVELEVSNYTCYKGGIKNTMYFGKIDDINQLRYFFLMKGALCIGIFLGCGYYISMFNKSIERRYVHISSAVFCISSVCLVMVVDGGIICSIFPKAPIDLPIKIQYFSMMGQLISMRYFIYNLSGMITRKIYVRIMQVINVCYILIFTFAPLNSVIFDDLTYGFILLSNTLVAMIAALNAIKMKRPHAKLITVAASTLFYTSVIQSLYFQYVFYNGFLSNFNIYIIGVLVLLLCHTYVLAQGVKQSHEESKLAKNMEIAFLQAQISPHFFFNVINNIYYLMDTDKELAKSLLISFSNYLRVKHKFDYRKTVFYTLKEELDLLDSFIEIENVRLSNKINYVKKVDETLLDMKILPLILQPLVENSIKHGYCLNPLDITVLVQTNGDEVQFEVSDNGKGMGVDKVSELNRNMKQSSGVGTKNINYRLEKCYHTKLIAESTLGKGTKIKFQVPMEVSFSESGIN